MNTNELLQCVKAYTAERGLELTNRELLLLREAFENSIIECLKSGRDVTLNSFCKFMLVSRAEHEARVPRTGEKIHVPAKTVVKVYPRKKLYELRVVDDD